MVDYEKGSPAWDIGIILTRHQNMAAGDPRTCMRVKSLQNTARRGIDPVIRLSQALSQQCTCGARDSDAERTSLKKETPNESEQFARIGS